MVKKKKVEAVDILLPKKNKDGRAYISYSQYSKFKSKKKDYIKSYFLGERFEGNAYTEFGTLVGEALENNDFSEFNETETALLSKVTRFDEFEREINWDLGTFVVNGYIDTNDKFPSGIKKNDMIVDNIVDYKTGAANKVEVYEADDYDQVTIYAGAVEQDTGHLPSKGWVELIERTGNPFRGEALKLGKEVFVIEQDVSKESVERVRKNLIKVANEIAASYKVFNLLNSVTI